MATGSEQTLLMFLICLFCFGSRFETADLYCFFSQGCGEEEEGEGADGQFGLSGGRVEGSEEEEEEVKLTVFVLIFSHLCGV